MKKGPSRFGYFLEQLDQLLASAAKQKNPALWLYRNNARTALFMLEGLAKLYAGLHNKKKFTNLQEQFKILEDVLGAIDYYDCFAKEFAANKRMPATVTAYLQAQTREKIQNLDELLKEKGWLGATTSKVDKIRKKLAGMDWKKEKDEIKAIHHFYDASVQHILDFATAQNFHFETIEAGVHEMRRKLRWLSIYPQALHGCVQLSEKKRTPKFLEKYLTKEITSSPFNVMPDAGDNTHFLLLEKKYFYALSWMIAELGRLKDNGLRVIAIKEALQQDKEITDAKAFSEAYRFTGPKQPKLEEIMKNADTICKTYFKEKDLQNLVIGHFAIK